MEAAHKKVMIKKIFDTAAEHKIFNLNSVSASCPVMNLPRNDYNLLYLRANQVSKFILQNKNRIRTYLRDNHNL